MDWFTVPKIDAHMHLLPPENLSWAEGPWKQASLETYLPLMDRYNIRKAVLLPVNEGPMFYRDPSKTNAWLSTMMKDAGGRFLAFADVVPSSYFPELSVDTLTEAVKDLGLLGLKIHPVNLGIPFDSLDMVPLIRRACDLHVPVMIHSYPSAFTDYNLCTPDRIHNMTRLFPDGTFIISHLGGPRWPDVIHGPEYVDISACLPEMVQLYGIPMVNRILRQIGPDRLIFATDYPQVRGVKAEDVYETYCGILNQMDFTEEEMEKIAWVNLDRLLHLS